MRGLQLFGALVLSFAFVPRALAHHHYDESTLSSDESLGSPTVPECRDNNGQPMQINNEQVLHWKESTPNLFRDRGFIRGTLVNVYNVNTSHLHLDVYIGGEGGTPGRVSDIEVIYNLSFGSAPAYPHAGSVITACGDYITSTAPSDHYPASPDGGIVHWIHRSPNGHHPDGFFMIDGMVYGQNNPRD
jgi:hypothetical protein